MDSKSLIVPLHLTYRVQSCILAKDLDTELEVVVVGIVDLVQGESIGAQRDRC